MFLSVPLIPISLSEPLAKGHTNMCGLLAFNNVSRETP